MVIDLHADTPLLMRWAGYDFCRAHRPWLPAAAWCSHVDLPRMEAGRLQAQLFGLVSLPVEPQPFATINKMIDHMERAEQAAGGRFRLVRTGAQLRACLRDGAKAGLLSIEGVHPLRGSLERADQLIDRGVVSFGLTHFHANEAARPAMGLGRREGEGLTEWGRALVAHLWQRGAIVDLTHVNRRGFFDALAVGDGPVIVSHTGVAGAHAHWRNLDDAQVRAVSDRGGVLGIIFARNFLGGSDVEAVVRHIKHAIAVGGSEAVALGSDFDGFIVPVKGLRDVQGLPALEEALLRAGLSRLQVDAVMGDNARRFLERSLG